jgi:hypothetical protein
MSDSAVKAQPARNGPAGGRRLSWDSHGPGSMIAGALDHGRASGTDQGMEDKVKALRAIRRLLEQNSDGVQQPSGSPPIRTRGGVRDRMGSA